MRTDRLNAHLMEQARTSAEINWLASPVTGGGVAVSRTELLFLLARSAGASAPADWGGFASQVLSMKAQRQTQDDGKFVIAVQDMAVLMAQAKSFAEKRLPVLSALQLA